MKKRLVIKSKVRFCTFICILTLLSTCLFGIVAANAGNVSNDELKTIHVQAGDTLWDIAEEHVPTGMDIREYIYDICKINEISADQLYTGMAVVLPTTL